MVPEQKKALLLATSARYHAMVPEQKDTRRAQMKLASAASAARNNAKSPEAKKSAPEQTQASTKKEATEQKIQRASCCLVISHGNQKIQGASCCLVIIGGKQRFCFWHPVIKI